MKIEKIEAFIVQIPMKGDYRMSRGAHTALHSLVVRVTTDDGIVGVGDAHQGVPGYSSETVDTMHAVVTNSYVPVLLNRPLESLEQLYNDLNRARMGNPFARSALDIALYDALSRANGIPIVEMLGGPVRQKLDLSASIGIDDPEKVAATAKSYVDSGFGTIKAKVGTADVDGDIERVRAIREAVGGSVKIRVDANANYSITDALKFMRGIADHDLDLVEQPVAYQDLAGMRQIRNLGIAPIMADESVVTPADAINAIQAGAVDAIKIKITKVGGYINARKIIDICEGANIKLILGQGLCSTLEAVAEAHLACAYEYVWPVAEMVGPTKLVDDLTDTPVDLMQGVMNLPEGPGLGVELSEEKLRKYEVTNKVAAS